MAISAVINTKNSATRLPLTLASVAFADEIIVVDMHSTDDTVTIAKRFGAKTYFFADVGYVEPARNFAISKARNEWILVLDADEVIPESLARELVALTLAPQADAYFLARKNTIFQAPVMVAGWWPDYQLRFFKKGTVTWSDTIHSVPTIQGKTAHLPSTEELAIDHSNYQSISDYLLRLDRYSSVQASEATQRSVTTTTVVKAFSEEFLSRLFALKGIDGGMHGVGLSFLQGLSNVAVMLKVWEQHGFFSTQKDQRQTIVALQNFQRELSFWIADWQAARSIGPKRWYYQLVKKWVGRAQFLRKFKKQTAAK